MATLSSRPSAGDGLFLESLTGVSVYIHIPFCSSRCNYCDFYFETTRSPHVIAATLDRIVEEAEELSTSLGRPSVRSLYFGGGTPSVVPPALLDTFLTRLRRALPSMPATGPQEAGRQPVEWTFEANPESLSAELLDVIIRHGVNRLSLGIQSFDDRLLRALTRRADRRTVLEALRLIEGARHGGTRLRLNVDLITGIPGQTVEMVKSDVDAALSFDVDHFSVYSLTVEERTPLRQAIEGGVRTMPAAARQDRLWLAARERILRAGFDWYEVSNFALPGFRSEHNMGYWRLEPYLGLGPGAVSTLPARTAGGEDSTEAIRLTNPNIFLYGSRLQPGWERSVEHLSPAELLLEHFITGLRTSEGVSFPHIEEVFGIDLSLLWRDRLDKWAAGGVADRDALAADHPRLVLTESGRLALDRRLLEIGEWIDELAVERSEWPAVPTTVKDATG